MAEAALDEGLEHERITIVSKDFTPAAMEFHRRRMGEQGYAIEGPIVRKRLYHVDGPGCARGAARRRRALRGDVHPPETGVVAGQIGDGAGRFRPRAPSPIRRSVTIAANRNGGRSPGRQTRIARRTASDGWKSRHQKRSSRTGGDAPRSRRQSSCCQGPARLHRRRSPAGNRCCGRRLLVGFRSGSRRVRAAQPRPDGTCATTLQEKIDAWHRDNRGRSLRSGGLQAVSRRDRVSGAGGRRLLDRHRRCRRRDLDHRRPAARGADHQRPLCAECRQRALGQPL